MKHFIYTTLTALAIVLTGLITGCKHEPAPIDYQTIACENGAFDAACPQPTQYWNAERLDDGKVKIVCSNGGDATVRPSDFGSIIVDCGAR
jgi:hypothetical protein